MAPACTGLAGPLNPPPALPSLLYAPPHATPLNTPPLPPRAGIHGWGLFAVRELPQDSLVMEYRGEAVRSSLADLREQGYRAHGADCYLFRATDTTVIDSTIIGSWSRFTNHCCAPSLYTKVCGPLCGWLLFWGARGRAPHPLHSTALQQLGLAARMV
jgi:hypothetical protein